VSFTVLIAASNHLAALTQLPDLTDAEPFADTDALKALDTITQRRPQVVALEQSFAASARGAAFINRIKADPALAACEIRILETGGSATAGTAPAAPPAAAPAATASTPTPAPTETPRIERRPSVTSSAETSRS
jgi:CHASE2 domain-containing sensor protein